MRPYDWSEEELEDRMADLAIRALTDPDYNAARKAAGKLDRLWSHLEKERAR